MSGRIGFIGAGMIAASLAQAFVQAALPVYAVASRTPASAKRLARELPGVTACTSPAAVVDSCDIVFLTVPDDAIQAVAESLAWRPGQLAVHSSGARSLDVLEPASKAGARPCSFHPFQTFVRPNTMLSGVTIGMEGTPDVLEELQGLARVIGARPLVLTPEHKALYHAAAVMASNYLVTLAWCAQMLLEQTGLTPEDAQTALLPIMDTTLHNIEHSGVTQALTGPIARNDIATVTRHLAALEAEAPYCLPIYRTLGLATLPLAAAKDGLDLAKRNRLAALLAAVATNNAENNEQ